MASTLLFLLISITLLNRVSGQTWTACNPLRKTCSPDPALGTSFNQTFSIDSSLNSDYWKVDAGPTISFDQDGALFTINQHGDAPTIETKFFIFWGRVEILMRAARGQGIISSLVLISDDLDEIDWEIMGGNSSYIETNYYGKGDVTQINSKYYPCVDPQGSLHNYTTVWTSEQLEWHLDGKLVRTLPFSEAVQKGKTIYPQTPMKLKIGSWAGGDPSAPKGRIQWAGGVTNYDDGPFDMYVKSIKVTDGTKKAMSYSYGDESGDWQSIKVKHGTSEASKAIHAPPPLTLSQRWNNLSPTIRIVIISVIGVVALALVVAFVWYCIHQRRLGRRERASEDAKWDKEQAEFLQYKQMMNRGEFSKGNQFVGVVQPITLV